MKPVLKNIEDLSPEFLEKLKDSIREYIEFLEEVKNGRPADKLQDYEQMVFECGLKLFCGDEGENYVNKILL